MNTTSRVTVHMAASLDGFIARRDGRVDWMETSDQFDGGETMAPETIAAFLKTIDCYVMGARTYETALDFEAKGFGWAYGTTPTVVLTHRHLRRINDAVEFYTGDVTTLINDRLKPKFASIWIAGGAQLATETLRLGLADELRYSILPVAIGDGISFFNGLGKDVALHLAEVTAYTSGMVALKYDIRK